MLFRSLSSRAFALLWGGQTISRVGDSIYMVALAWWVLQHTGSATAMGAVLICTNVPALLFLLIGGVAVDRFPRIAVMLVSDIARGVVMSIIAVLAVVGRLALWHLCALAAIFGLVRAFFAPAYTAIAPDIVPPGALPSANALQSISVRLAGVVGPALGGAVIAGGDTTVAFALNGFSFFIAAVCLIAAGPLPLRAHTAAVIKPDVWSELRAGFRVVRALPWLWVTLLVAAISTLFLSGRQAVLPLLVAQHLRGGAGGFALLKAVEAGSALATAVWIGRWARLRHRGYLVYAPWLTIGLAMAVMGLPVSLAGATVATCTIGVCAMINGLAWTNMLQELAPRDMLGRVASIDVFVSESLTPVGFGLAGIAADHIGAAPVYVIGGLSMAAVIGAGLLHPVVRAVD